jgi:Family of unknown function (DUF6356)
MCRGVRIGVKSFSDRPAAGRGAWRAPRDGVTHVRRLFTQHPASVGETYGQHFAAAFGFAVTMVAGGLACLVHAPLPFLFATTAATRSPDCTKR